VCRTLRWTAPWSRPMATWTPPSPRSTRAALRRRRPRRRPTAVRRAPALRGSPARAGPACCPAGSTAGCSERDHRVQHCPTPLAARTRRRTPCTRSYSHGVRARASWHAHHKCALPRRRAHARAAAAAPRGAGPDRLTHCSRAGAAGGCHAYGSGDTSWPSSMDSGAVADAVRRAAPLHAPAPPAMSALSGACARLRLRTQPCLSSVLCAAQGGLTGSVWLRRARVQGVCWLALPSALTHVSARCADVRIRRPDGAGAAGGGLCGRRACPGKPAQARPLAWRSASKKRALGPLITGHRPAVGTWAGPSCGRCSLLT